MGAVVGDVIVVVYLYIWILVFIVHRWLRVIVFWLCSSVVSMMVVVGWLVMIVMTWSVMVVMTWSVIIVMIWCVMDDWLVVILVGYIRVFTFVEYLAGVDSWNCINNLVADGLVVDNFMVVVVVSHTVL